jgi:FkbM family methyltransferase
MHHFFDIGGNTGQSFQWMEGQDFFLDVNIVWVFEPSPRHFAELIRACQSFTLRHPDRKVRLCPFGLSDQSSTRLFFEKDDPRGDSFHDQVRADHAQENLEQGYSVVASAISLASFITRATAASDTITLDIDAEGEEFAMLESLLDSKGALGRVSRIFAEFHWIKSLPGNASMAPKARAERIARRLFQANIPLTVRGCIVQQSEIQAVVKAPRFSE